MKRASFSAALLTLWLAGTAVPVALGGDQSAGGIPRVDGKRAMKHVRKLVSIGPRHSGSQGARKTAAYIAAEARAIGYQPAVRRWKEKTPAGKLTFRNVIATLSSPHADGFVVIGSHYDTKRLPECPDFAGANDGGSSTALLLEVIRVMHARKAAWSGPNLVFVFFDGEECIEEYGPNDGLHGSRHFVKRLRKRGRLDSCKAMILLDMIGDCELSVTIPKRSHRVLVNAVMKAAAKQGLAETFSRTSRIIDDHLPFIRADVPAINLIDFQYGPDNAYWHSPEDSLDHVCAASMRSVGNVALAALFDLFNR